MSTGLMSCVRENSPSFEMTGSETGELVLEQQKRRRFHPLRNLRRIFRRRTLTSVATPIASSPSSSSTGPTAIYASTQTNSLSSTQHADILRTSTNDYLPVCDRSRTNYRLTLTSPFSSINTSKDSSCLKTENDYDGNILHKKSTGDESQEITEYQRSFSEGILVENDFSRENLSQSHDSVFSESATASSLSIGLKAELFDVLRKRRNRRDVSDEDLGLPNSPTTSPQKESIINQSEISSLSLLSIDSVDLDESYLNLGGNAERIILKQNEGSKGLDSMDFEILVGSRLSHSAAKHKMAVRPKKKGPPKQKQLLESKQLPTTPEVKEEYLKVALLENTEANIQRIKSHSLPSGINPKVLKEHINSPSDEISTNSKNINVEKKSSSSTYITTSLFQSEENLSHLNLNKNDDEAQFFIPSLYNNSKKNERGVNVQKQVDGNSESSKITHTENENNEYKILQLSQIEMNKEMENVVRSESKLTMTDRESRRNIFKELVLISPQKIQKPKSGPAARQRIVPKDLTVLPPKRETDSNYVSQYLSEQSRNQNINIIAPKAECNRKAHLDEMVNSSMINSCNKTALNVLIVSKIDDDEVMLSKILSDNSSKVLPTEQQTTFSQSYTKNILAMSHFEKKERKHAKIFSLATYPQKIPNSDSSTCIDHIGAIFPKQRKGVLKSKSFRYYSEGEQKENILKKQEHMPSLPDLTQSSHFPDNIEFLKHFEQPVKKTPTGFEIDDKNLIIKLRNYEEPQTLSRDIPKENVSMSDSYELSTNSTLTTSNGNIKEIEENIDKRMKSSLITVLKQSSNYLDSLEAKKSDSVSFTPIHELETEQKQESTQCVQLLKEVYNFNKKIIDDSKNTNLGKFQNSRTDFIESMSKKVKYSKLQESNIDNKNREITTVKTSHCGKLEENIVPEFMKIQLNRIDSAKFKSNIILSKNVKEINEKDSTKRFSNENIEITYNNKPFVCSEFSAIKRNSMTNIIKLQNELLRSPFKQMDEENNIFSNAEDSYSNQMLIERCKPVTDEKIKFEKKVAEKTLDQLNIADINQNASRKSIEEEDGVILRKKSYISPLFDKEDTPELIKVFARRSLKIKDSDDLGRSDEITSSDFLNKPTNLDSDKENLSSSEEKLDRITNVDITVQANSFNQNVPLKADEKSSSDFAMKITGNSSKSVKPFLNPVRYSGSMVSNINYRNISSVLDDSKKKIPTIGAEQMNAISGNNNKLNLRYTVDCTTSNIRLEQNENGKFKGILQRRAEWEKRAKEALK